MNELLGTSHVQFHVDFKSRILCLFSQDYVSINILTSLLQVSHLSSVFGLFPSLLYLVTQIHGDYEGLMNTECWTMGSQWVENNMAVHSEKKADIDKNC